MIQVVIRPIKQLANRRGFEPLPLFSRSGSRTDEPSGAGKRRWRPRGWASTTFSSEDSPWVEAQPDFRFRRDANPGQRCRRRRFRPSRTPCRDFWLTLRYLKTTSSLTKSLDTQRLFGCLQSLFNFTKMTIYCTKKKKSTGTGFIVLITVFNFYYIKILRNRFRKSL